MRAIALTLGLTLFGCAVPSTETVIFIGPGPPAARDEAPSDAVDALDIALELPIPADAVIPIAGYLSAAHRRLHTAFAEGSLVEFERTHAAVEGDLTATLDLSLAEADGRIVDLRLLRTSGFGGFDGAAISGALRASPFGAPPRDIVGNDACAHLAWRFHRRAADPCALTDAVVMRSPEP